MTSILDQYEQASQVSQRPKPVEEAMTSSGYINMQLEDNTPIFSKQKMNFNPSDVITHGAVASDYLVLAMANGNLFRMDLKMPSHFEEIKYTKYIQSNTKLTGLYLDPLGCHLLMAFAPRTKDGNPELVYLHRKSSKLKSVTKSRSYEVTEVGWNNENTSEITTGPILLGSSQGHIIETELVADNDKMFTANQQYWRQIFDIGQGTDMPITGIQFHRVSNTSKYFIFITTPTRLYQFIGNAVTTDGRPSLQSIFYQYLTMPDTGFQEIPSSLKYSRLQFHFDRDEVPKSFAWLTEPGIFYGQLDPSSQQNSNTLFTQGELINYPPDFESEIDSKEKAPLSFVLTEFHALLMYSDRVKAVSLLNQECVYEDRFSEAHGKLKNIVKDVKRRTVWAITEKTVFRYKIVREERNVWRIYMEKEQFDLAKLYCLQNPVYLDIVNVKQAELLFSKGKYEDSANVYADTQSSFETVCLKFLEQDQINALQIYLCKRLDTLDEDDKTLISMVVIWMTELYLSQLGLLRRTGKLNTDEYNRIQSDFDVFLVHPKVSKCMQHVKKVIYDLMSSHGDKQNLIKLTLMNEDYENVVAQNIYRKSYTEALKTLQDLKKPELFYQFAPVLMEEDPKRTVNTLISQGPRLSPSKLLPAFLSCENDEKHISEIIRYLEFMVQNYNVKERAIHNYLLTLYCEYDQQALMRYLERQGTDAVLVNYDVHYAKRLCHEKDLPEACVKLSALLGLWEAAVSLALQVSLPLAKSIANMPDDVQLQRSLWLNIAENVITKNQNVAEAMGFLDECPLIKIEDLLPFFSDVVTIDHFREPICQSLQEYNNQIEELKAEMEEATKSAELVRSEIQSFRNRSVHVSVTDECCLCEITLLLRPFYLFPCGHKFHSDCLQTEIQPTLGPARRNKLQDVQTRLSVLSSIELNTRTSSGLPLRELLKNEIDDIVASECLYCGEYMINCIDKPFISDEDWDRVMKEWE
ncbi:vacuolar protein sorting-associated protein 18 homolog isoform X2 [Plodia interpunctella]|uniref:vacuolar protein sorting-associated protein 18 homolog isoform X2 n=1 Tax=Plodia interpunctella TaxID=58824 RepID=UPI00236810C5|nr:vacuolar protein sorting-associated protein 18 homolog isoform X2 [Plodia interpunctella]